MPSVVMGNFLVKSTISSFVWGSWVCVAVINHLIPFANSVDTKKLTHRVDLFLGLFREGLPQFQLEFDHNPLGSLQGSNQAGERKTIFFFLVILAGALPDTNFPTLPSVVQSTESILNHPDIAVCTFKHSDIKRRAEVATCSCVTTFEFVNHSL
jgi:hypothetical protein